MNTLALYTRVSNEDENLGESATIQNQRDLLYHYIQSRPEFKCWNVLEFQDDGWSGTTFDRPGIGKLLELAGKEVQCIIVKDFSRFGRNLIEVGNYLDQIFPFLGVRFIAVNEGYDSNDNAGRTIGLDVSLKAMVYEMYSRDLSKKISSVKEEQMKRGHYAGSFAFYGYRKSNVSKSGLEIDPEAAGIVKRIFTLAASGVKTLQIAVLLNKEGILPPFSYRKQKKTEEHFQCPTATEHNIWTQARVAAIIRDERYTGVLISKKKQRIDISTKKIKLNDRKDWIRVENALNAIVTRAEFEQAQEVLVPHGKRNTVTPSEPFRGLLKCGICGKALDRIDCKNPYFRCATGRFQPDSLCVEIGIERKGLEQTVLSSMKYQIQLILEEKSSDKTGSEITIRQKLEKLDGQMGKYKFNQMILFERFADDMIDREQFTVEKKKIAEQISTLQAEKEELLGQLQKVEKSEQLEEHDLGRYAFVETLSRDLLETLVKEIRILPDHVIEINWNFQ
ncbi:recombinase family protein [Hungatella hathewayi]|uniref:recombinase family protein n=1 Tax=Hungatella hathewayi TaxID=154046 RepID=UPI0035658C3D